MSTWFDRMFQREEMDGDGRCPTYLIRWTLLKLWGGRSIYLHKFVGDDWSYDLHDHPKRFISLGLKGSYVEQTPAPEADAIYPYSRNQYRERASSAPWIRTFPAAHVHRIRLRADRRPCWTLVIVLKTSRRWGFWNSGHWIPWRDYVNSETATERKSCGG